MSWTTNLPLSLVASTVLTLVAATSTTSGQQARILVTANAEPASVGQSWKLFAGVLVNSSSSEILLKAIQMPGGYVGSGTFFACTVEQWNPHKQAWQVLRQPERGDSPNLKTVRVGPGDQVEVCRELVPRERLKQGECMRFKLRQSWAADATFWVSDAFIAGDKSTGKVCP
jgi:hypothetical protein